MKELLENLKNFDIEMKAPVFGLILLGALVIGAVLF